MKTNSSLHSAALQPAPCGSRNRNTKNRITAVLALALGCVMLLALGGCASTNKTGGKGKQALVCPQCKMVAMTVYRPYVGNSSRFSSPGTTTVYDDKCPGCQGAIVTLFKEGKLKHKCSICKETPFTCPVFHPIQN